MDTATRIESALKAAVARASSGAPAALAAGLQHAVFPGGARLRPQLTLAVAEACGDADPPAAEAAGAAIELLHAASLVHDDLPCFDNAHLRRGAPSVHSAYGEPTAVLVGDALIVLAFETVALAASRNGFRCGPIVSLIARATGSPAGLAAGQAWEMEPGATAEQCRCAKTAALFVAATMAGAVAGGGDPEAWRPLGQKLGEAYQVADDLFDACGGEAAADKPLGQDAAHGRPTAVSELGVAGAAERLQELVSEAVRAIPPSAGSDRLAELVRIQAMRLAPKGLAQSAA